MEIRNVEAEERAEFVAFLDAGLRPAGGPTRVEDDFPVALGAGNLPGLYGIRDAQGWAAGLSVLVRDLVTSVGDLAVAMLGSVVTRTDLRGQGLSRRLQAAVLADLERQEIPLAVLWTDRPALYAGRGFGPAGWEHHVELARAAARPAPRGTVFREFAPQDTATVAALYDAHALRTRRRPDDHAPLYGMPGTRGLLLVGQGGEVQAHAFCGKGEDFPDYVAEWAGAPAAAVAVLGEVARRGWAGRALVPPGTAAVLARLAELGAGGTCLPSGLWAVLNPDPLARVVTAAGGATPVPERRREASAWLGSCEPGGEPSPGPITAAVWGLDSI